MIFLSLLKLKKKEGPDCPTTARDQSCHIILFWKSDKRNNKYLKLNFISLQHVLKESGDFFFFFWAQKLFLATLGHFFTRVLFVSGIGFSFIVKWRKFSPKKKKKTLFQIKIKILYWNFIWYFLSLLKLEKRGRSWPSTTSRAQSCYPIYYYIILKKRDKKEQ